MDSIAGNNRCGGSFQVRRESQSIIAINFNAVAAAKCNPCSLIEIPSTSRREPCPSRGKNRRAATRAGAATTPLDNIQDSGTFATVTAINEVERNTIDQINDAESGTNAMIRTAPREQSKTVLSRSGRANFN